MLKDKDDEISKLVEQLCRAKEDTIKEYRNSDTLLYQLGGSFTDNFADCLRQVKASFLDLDLSHISIDAQGQTPACPVNQGDSNELFANDTIPNPQDDEETAPYEDQVKSVRKEAIHLGGTRRLKRKTKRLQLTSSRFISFSFFFFKELFGRTMFLILLLLPIVV